MKRSNQGPLRLQPLPAGSAPFRCRAGGRRASVADNAIAVPVAHEPVRGVAPRDRRDAVAPRLGARDAAVAVVVVESERVAGGGSRRGAPDQPTGWMRHPKTGRRRPDGDPGREYILF